MLRLSTVPGSIRRWPLFHTIDLTKISGITFFLDYNDRSLIGLHAHHGSGSSAMLTWNRLDHRRTKIAWQYLPIAPEDKIVAMATNQSFGLVIMVWLNFLASSGHANRGHFRYGCSWRGLSR